MHSCVTILKYGQGRGNEGTGNHTHAIEPVLQVSKMPWRGSRNESRHDSNSSQTAAPDCTPDANMLFSDLLEREAVVPEWSNNRARVAAVQRWWSMRVCKEDGRTQCSGPSTSPDVLSSQWSLTLAPTMADPPILKLSSPRHLLM